jgi:hypothetical protein
MHQKQQRNSPEPNDLSYNISDEMDTKPNTKSVAEGVNTIHTLESNPDGSINFSITTSAHLSKEAMSGLMNITDRIHTYALLLNVPIVWHGLPHTLLANTFCIKETSESLPSEVLKSIARRLNELQSAGIISWYAKSIASSDHAITHKYTIQLLPLGKELVGKIRAKGLFRTE